MDIYQNMMVGDNYLNLLSNMTVLGTTPEVEEQKTLNNDAWEMIRLPFGAR